MSSERTARLAVIVLVALAPACADFSRGAPTARPDGSADGGIEADADGGAPLSYAAAVANVLAGACAGCHVPGGQAGDTQLLLTGDAADDYATVLRFVDTSAPAGSRLLAKATGHGHGGGVALAPGSTEYETVLLWIQQGARP